MSPVLGYWQIRGLAQPIRLLLAYKEISVTEKRYRVGPKPQFDRSQWTDEKYSHSLDFPNLPYYIDGDLRLTQSLAIMRYLARKYQLGGSSQQEENRIDLLEQQLKDLNQSFTTLCYDTNFEKLKTDYLKTLPEKLLLLDKFLSERPYFAGERLTYVDFLAYELLDQLKLFAPQIVNQYKNLVQFHSRFESLPTIANYLKSDQYIRWPLNNDSAQFGSRLQDMP